jgi:hypothetical protein
MLDDAPLWEHQSMPVKLQNMDAPLHCDEYFVAK